MPSPLELTRHHALPRKYAGYTAMDWFKFYGMVAVLLFWLAYTYTKYFELFDDIADKEPAYQAFVMFFSGLPLLLVLIAALGFFWWAGGALMRHSRWGERHPLFWRVFWSAVLLFYGYVEFDPLDSIHPLMSRKGMAPAPNLLKLFDGEFEWFMFQWGYFLLWALFWFLVVAVHWSYILDGWRTVWFYGRRFERYGASVLTGFNVTAKTLRRPPVTRDWPREQPAIPPAFRGVPQLVASRLTEEQARAIIEADASGAIVAAPEQPTVLFVDLGRYVHSPALELLKDGDGALLLTFEDWWAPPTLSRESLVIPLRHEAVKEASN
ncbi:hypothetical protein IIA79_06210 [bacterium]|nr:hypothetical protein [bacterium]